MAGDAAGVGCEGEGTSSQSCPPSGMLVQHTPRTAQPRRPALHKAPRLCRECCPGQVFGPETQPSQEDSYDFVAGILHKDGARRNHEILQCVSHPIAVCVCVCVCVLPPSSLKFVRPPSLPLSLTHSLMHMPMTSACVFRLGAQCMQCPHPCPHCHHVWSPLDGQVHSPA
jgi:hypothetical protein